MPSRPLKPCKHCGKASPDGYCDSHRHLKVRFRFGGTRRNPARQHDHAFYKSPAWKRCRKAYLGEHPLCEHCLKVGRTTAAVMVDHIVPVALGGAKLSWSNLQSLCRACESRKDLKDMSERAAAKRAAREAA